MAKVAVSIHDSNEDDIAPIQRRKDKRGTSRSVYDDEVMATITVDEHVTEVAATAAGYVKLTASTHGYYVHDRQLIVSGEKLNINIKFHHHADVANGINWGVCNGKAKNKDGEQVANIQLDPKFRGRSKLASLEGERITLSACRDSGVTTVDGEIDANLTLHLVVDLCEMRIQGQKMTIKLARQKGQTSAAVGYK